MVRPDTSSIVGEMFRQHGSVVYRRALRLLGSPADAEEAMHEIFIRVMKNTGAIDERRGQVTTWLYEITTNYCLARLRDHGRRRALLDQRLAAPETSHTPEHEQLLLLRRLLAKADEREAQAAVYVHLDGMSQAEAAAQLGVSQRTVSNLLDRFMRWAQEQVEQEEQLQPRAEGVR